eukprot:159751-Chlamydomonas_euryale.AAC.3
MLYAFECQEGELTLHAGLPASLSAVGQAPPVCTPSCPYRTVHTYRTHVHVNCTPYTVHHTVHPYCTDSREGDAPYREILRLFVAIRTSRQSNYEPSALPFV